MPDFLHTYVVEPAGSGKNMRFLSLAIIYFSLRNGFIERADVIALRIHLAAIVLPHDLVLML
jgi:hypothetical protein